MIFLKIPNDIKSDYEGYNFFVNLFHSVKDLKEQEIIFDFKEVSFFEANLSAVFGVMLEMLFYNNNKVKFHNVINRVETILRKNEFLTQLGYAPVHDDYDTSLRYMRFEPADDEGFNNYIKNQLLGKRDFPAISKMLSKEILRNIFEIYENARTHGKCDFIHTCGQFFPRKPNKPLHFTVVDKGLNIKENVSSFRGKEIDAREAIEWAMVKGNTTKLQTSGGLGLALIFEFIKLNRGKIQIVSANGFYEYRNGLVTTEILDNYFEGTIVNITFNFNDTSFYSLNDEKEDLSNLF
ncbi:hypothetical protein [Kaistella montana]|uniref:ATP-binding protein n=1 Tax=Kaistella montana TaxID=1849733 RepID=A0ABW5K8L3_9FLAO|nr:hypothetical protein [Kaistella montana]MCQ4035497.1 hypothetical protein [Kaistella montana]